MIEREGDAALAPCVRSQHGRGVFVYDSSMLTVANGSSIDGNTAEVSSSAFALASGLVVGLPSDESTLNRCERETSR